jgi:Spy/CpxP family protein refolding chaperone
MDNPNIPHSRGASQMELAYYVSLGRRALLLSSVLLVGCFALFAQQDAPPATTAPPEHRRGPGVERELNELTRVLTLTEEQRAQVKTLLAERRQQMEALRNGTAEGANTSQQPRPTREQMDAIHEATSTKITALLNEDQKPKFAAWEQQRKAEMEKWRGQQGQGAPQPQ